MVITIDAQGAAATPEALECAASAALDALVAAAADGAESASTITRLSPGVGFAAQGTHVAQAGPRAALYVGAPPPTGWGGAQEVEEEEEEGDGAAAGGLSGAERVLSLVSELSAMLPDDAVESAKAALEALSDATAGEDGGDGFALVAFDAAEPGSGGPSTLLVARDAAGAAPLWWGTTPQGLLLVGADPADLADCYPSAVEFPRGAFFHSAAAGEAEAGRAEPGARGFIILAGEEEGGAVRPPAPGRLASFVQRGRAPGTGTLGRPPVGPPSYRPVRSIPRVTSAGLLCGAVFRVASEGESLVDLTRPRAGRA